MLNQFLELGCIGDTHEGDVLGKGKDHHVVFGICNKVGGCHA